MSDAVKPDTSEAAVERDAATVEHFARVWPEDAEESVRDAMRNSLVHISALLRALLAERDALRAQLAETRATLQIAQDGNAALRWAVALREIQRAAAAALEITPDCEMFATLHRTAASALASDDGPQNEAALREAGHETRALTPDEQKIMRRALRRSVKIVGGAGHE